MQHLRRFGEMKGIEDIIFDTHDWLGSYPNLSNYFNRMYEIKVGQRSAVQVRQKQIKVSTKIQIK